jgi:uncharacterized protein YjbJ (UPF0337 family)
MLNKNIIQGKWKEVKGKLHQQWGDITNDEVSKMHGSYEELAGMLQKKYGYDERRSEKEIENFVKKNHWDESGRTH